MRSALLPAATLALAGCATATEKSASLVYVGLAGAGPCSVALDGRRYQLPQDAAALARQAKQLAARSDGAIVGGEEGLSFACWRESMAIIRQAGFPRLGLVAEAPAPPAEVEEPARPDTRESPTAR